jgi:uncharacterized protein (TIGR03382 family)
VKLFSLARVAVSLLLIPSLAEASVSTYAVVMTSQQEAPSGGGTSTSTATGSTTLAFDDVTKRLTGTLTYAGLSGPPVAAHIHQGACGVSGAVDETLAASATSPMAIDVVLAPAEETALATNDLYVDFHTAQHPDGEIRGQILSAGSPMCTGPQRPLAGAAVALGSHIDAEDAGASAVDASCPSSSPKTDAGAAAATAAQGGDVGCSAGGSAPDAAWVIAGALVLAVSVRRRRRAA